MPPKIIFRTMNRAHIALYRATGGKLLGSIMGSPVLLLTTTGRKTGTPRTTPLVYAPDGDCYAVIASDRPAWYANLRSQPQASIELKDTRIPVRAHDVSPEAESRLWAQFIQQSPAFKSFKEQGSHQLVLLEPLNKGE